MVLADVGAKVIAASMPPRFSLICPTYNVESYVHRFLRSIEEQSFDLQQVEVVLVDDGSTDSSGEILAAWSTERDHPTKFVHQQNAGLSAARNHGLRLATGEWVLFPDPDDALAPDLLTKVDAFVRLHHDPPYDIVALRRLIYVEDTGRVKDTHPLGVHFDEGDRVVDVGPHTREFQLAVNSAALRRSAIVSSGVEFPDISLFEDALFIGDLLMRRGTGLGFCAGAEYLWTRRSTGGSMTQSSWARRSMYDEVLRDGYLKLLRDASVRYGQVPDWAARAVLYGIHWYVRIEQKPENPIVDLPDPIVDVLNKHVVEAIGMMDIKQVRDFDLAPNLEVLWGLRSFREETFVSPALVTAQRGRDIAVELTHKGVLPDLVLTFDGEAAHSSRREEPIRVLGRNRLTRTTFTATAPRRARSLEVLLNSLPWQLITSTRTSPRGDGSEIRTQLRLRDVAEPNRGPRSSARRIRAAVRSLATSASRVNSE
jgi:glycosyltransferase involved in cell wall biosynthesis